MITRRRPYRLRYSLSSLFVLTLICAAAFFLLILRPELDRQRLIREIESLGGTVDVSDHGSFALFESQRIDRVTLDQIVLKRITPARLLAFPNLAHLVIEDFDLKTERTHAKGDKIELELPNNHSLEVLANAIGLPSSTRAAGAPIDTLRVRTSPSIRSVRIE